MSDKAEKIVVTIPAQLARRLRPLGNRLNRSAICAVALEEAVTRIEREMREEEGRADVLARAGDPLTIAEVRQTGKISLSPSAASKIATYPPAQREAYLAGHNAGTATIWNVLNASERPVLPMVYTPPSKGDKSES